MTKDERFIIENAAAGDDLDALLATHRCTDCAEFTFLYFDGLWLCQTCSDERSVRGEPAIESMITAQVA